MSNVVEVYKMVTNPDYDTTKIDYKTPYKDRPPRMIKEQYCHGSFLQWGVDFEEFETGAGNYSTAIVKLPNGEIITPPADMIKFIKG